MVSFARATRGLRRPSLDARSRRPIRPPSIESEQSRKEQKREQPGALLARRAPTIKRWSLDARSKGQPWPLPLRKNKSRKALVGRAQWTPKRGEKWKEDRLRKTSVALCSRSAHDQNVLARRAQWDHPRKLCRKESSGEKPGQYTIICPRYEGPSYLLAERSAVVDTY